MLKYYNVETIVENFLIKKEVILANVGQRVKKESQLELLC